MNGKPRSPAGKPPAGKKPVKKPVKKSAKNPAKTTKAPMALVPAPGPELVPEIARDPKTPKFVVGIGGSAGALEAFEQFFHNIPDNTGLAFILVPHLDPTHKGLCPSSSSGSPL